MRRKLSALSCELRPQKVHLNRKSASGGQARKEILNIQGNGGR
jgi:hypothetical protein